MYDVRFSMNSHGRLLSNELTSCLYGTRTAAMHIYATIACSKAVDAKQEFKKSADKNRKNRVHDRKFNLQIACERIELCYLASTRPCACI